MKAAVILSMVFSTWTLTSYAQVVHKKLDSKILHEAKKGTGTKPAERVYIDFDSDGTDDTYLSHVNYPDFGIWNLNFNEVDTNSPQVEFHFDKTLGLNPFNKPYIKELAKDVEVSSAMVDWQSDYPLLADIYNPNLLGKGEVYVGVRLMKGSDYHYGWIKLEVSGVDGADLAISISEYAYEKEANKSVKAGQTKSSVSTGIEGNLNLSASKLQVFPNPATDFITIESSNATTEIQMNVFDLTGNLVLSNMVTDNEQIAIDGLDKGMYLLQLEYNSVVSTQRLVVQ